MKGKWDIEKFIILLCKQIKMKVYRKTVYQSSVKIFSEDIKINGNYLSSFI